MQVLHLLAPTVQRGQQVLPGVPCHRNKGRFWMHGSPRGIVHAEDSMDSLQHFRKRTPIRRVAEIKERPRSLQIFWIPAEHGRHSFHKAGDDKICCCREQGRTCHSCAALRPWSFRRKVGVRVLHGPAGGSAVDGGDKGRWHIKVSPGWILPFWGTHLRRAALELHAA